MAFDLVNSIVVRPDCLGDFQERVAALATEAARSNDPWKWTAHQTLFGQSLSIHFVTHVESFEQIDAIGSVEALWSRALGEKKGRESFLRTNACLQGVQQSVSAARPDLSYGDGLEAPDSYPYAVITTVRARPGHAEACEELIRKVAEAIPKVGDPARMLGYQVVLGDLGVYWTVRPLRRLADLDQQRQAPALLDEAFGRAEGGLLWRSGSEAIEQARREVVRLVPELSNPPRG